MAVVHVVIVVYMALGLAAQIKVRYKIGYGLDDAPPSLGRALRDYAPVVFVVPVTWAVFAFKRWRRNGADLLESGIVMGTGLAVAFSLFFIAFLGTISVWSKGSLIQAKLPPNKAGEVGDAKRD
ncbi:MAG: hypothetical protein R3F19_00825 [Verrucomicrobiales bacterium]